MSDNYPDDIRDYDNDPRSPFYDDSRAEWIEERTQEMFEEISASHEKLNDAINESTSPAYQAFIRALSGFLKTDNIFMEDKVLAVYDSLRDMIDDYAEKEATKEADDRDRDEQ